MIPALSDDVYDLLARVIEDEAERQPAPAAASTDGEAS